MIDLVVRDGAIELVGHTADASLEDLSRELDAFRAGKGLKTDRCAGCGECCRFETLPVLGYDLAALRAFLGVRDDVLFAEYLRLPERPDVEARRKSISDIARQNDVDAVTAALLYEYNQAEPITLVKGADGACRFLRDNRCSIYGARLYTCGLYLCTMGERLSVLQEQIVRQGVWHGYSLLGWVPESDLAHNPFLRYGGYAELPIAELEFDLESALESLFFFF